MVGNDRVPLGGPARRAAKGGLTPALRLATGELWDTEHNRATGSGCNSRHESPDLRRSRAYIERFPERIPLGRAIRLKCGSCMGGEVGQMPRGEVAQAVDECGSCTYPLWPFRLGNDPWRPELSEAKIAAVRRAGEKARRCLEAQRRRDAGSATGHSSGTLSPPEPETAWWPGKLGGALAEAARRPVD